MHIQTEERRWIAFCLDVSVSGIGAWSAEPMNAGDTLSATFKLDGEEFEVRAEVVRCEDSTPARLGMRITRLHPHLFTLLEAA